MNTVTVSAPGKLHLSGEHSVVHGKPALIVATSLRLFVTIDYSAKAPTFNDLCTDDPYIATIVETLQSAEKIRIDMTLRCLITSTIPIGAGMGSSAALAVALIGALMVWHGLPWKAERINELAYRAEKFKHGNSSGSDPAIATNGGILWYRKELDFLKTLWLLTMKIPDSFPPLVLIHTGRTESSGDLIRVVQEKKEAHGQWFDRTLNAIERVTKSMTQAIHDEHMSEFMRAITENERLLESLGVVSRSVKSLIRQIEADGGAAKISGAGGVRTGSGVVIAVANRPEAVRELAKKAGHPAFQVMIGAPGARVEGARA